MKTVFFSVVATAMVSITAMAQDIPQSQVPSLIVNDFQQKFPKARRVEWELKGDQYKVEFETGILGDDHDVYYSRDGKLVHHKEEISKSDLPKNVLSKISKDFGGYRADDIEKISENGRVNYKM